MKYIIILSIILFSSNTFSHSGNTDRYGCHNDNINGGYHCHNPKVEDTPKKKIDNQAKKNEEKKEKKG